MKTECCVLGCHSSRYNVPFHKFPKNLEQFLAWKAAIYSDKIRGLTESELRNRMVCYRHFKDDDYVEGYKIRRLKSGVIPSVALPCATALDAAISTPAVDLEVSQDEQPSCSYYVEEKTRSSEPNTAVRSAAVEVEVSRNVRPSCSYHVQDGNTHSEANTAVHSAAVEVEVSRNVRPSCSYHVQDGNTHSEANTAVHSAAVEVEVSRNVRPSCSYYHAQDGNTHSEANTDVRSAAVEVEVSRSRTPGQSRKPRLSLLGNAMKAGNLTPRKAKLYRIARLLCRKQAYADKKLRTVRQRLREAEEFFTTKSVDSLISTLSPTQQAFIEMQLKASKHAPRGRRFSMKEKILCLSIYKQSRRAYRLLETLFHLPSGRVLRTLLRGMVLRPGLNENMMEHLAEKARSMSRMEKICCLMWDEVCIQPHIDVSPALRRIVGFEDHGKVRRSKFADVALVFMLRGIKTGWKLPLAFYFSDSQTTSADLMSCIIEVTEAVANCGLRIAAYVCDQGSSNVKAVNHLVADTAIDAPQAEKLSGNIIHLHDQTIVAVYDPPHLIKGVRNNLLTKDLESTTPAGDGKEYLSWETIELAYDIDNVRPDRRQMKKITKEHIRRNKIRKMRVKHAVQVLSETMALYIDHHSRIEGCIRGIRGPLSMPNVEGEAAAELIGFFNNLFDSCNGHTKNPESRYRVAVTPSGPHMRFWTDAIQRLERMQFVDSKNKQKKERSSVLRNWITTVKGFQSLNKILQGEGLNYWFPRYINQDPLENFFGCIKSLGFRDNKPTALQFISNFKTLIINNITAPRSIGFNCERKGTGNILFNFSSLLNSPNLNNIVNEGTVMCQPTLQTYGWIDTDFCSQVLKSFLNVEALKACTLCNNISFAVASGQAQAIIQKYLEPNCYSFITCAEHQQQIQDLFVHASVRVSLQNWTGYINKILMGKESSCASADSMENEAEKKYKKRQKRKKKV